MGEGVFALSGFHFQIHSIQSDIILSFQPIMLQSFISFNLKSFIYDCNY